MYERLCVPHLTVLLTALKQALGHGKVSCLVEFGLRPAIVAHGTKGRGQVSQRYCTTVKQHCLLLLISAHPETLDGH